MLLKHSCTKMNETNTVMEVRDEKEEKKKEGKKIAVIEVNLNPVSK